MCPRVCINAGCARAPGRPGQPQALGIIPGVSIADGFAQGQGAMRHVASGRPRFATVELINELSGWNLTLRDGESIEIWADSYEEQGGSYVFGVLANVAEDARSRLDISASTPSDPDRVVVTLARIPTDLVEVIRSA